ncbi:copper resistance protein CopC [Nocardioides sp.]|uniref:copper resistance CopC/CopD family protein n=1 Tax=Nocardioides sp. TaxID=35761 RepID=UPI002B264BEE|nr:copper resistance protein CopC [Nocardioides sp.]
MACLVLLAVLAGAAPASAHATLIATDPNEGEVLATAPDEVTFTFDEPVTLAADGVQVFDATGAPLPAESAGRDAVITTDLPDDLDDGTYVLVWRAVSADGHPIAGSLTFSVGEASLRVVAPVVPDAAGGSVRWALSAVQAVGYVGLLTAGGLVLFLGWTTAGVRLEPRVRRRLQRLLVGSTGLALGSGLLALPLIAAYQQGADWSGISPSPELSLVDDDLLVLGLQAVGLLAALRLLSRPRVAVVAAAAAVLAPALVGHSRAVDPVWLLTLTDALHLVVGAAWLGGLVGLAATLPSLSGRARDGAAALTRFSEVAAGLLVVLAITGTLMGWRILGGWGPLVETDYGRLLLVKVVIALLVAAIAGWNRWRLLPAVHLGVGHAAQRSAVVRVARVVRAEAALLVVLLGVTGFLVNLSPSEETENRAAVGSRVEAGPLDESRVLATLVPGRQGPNTLTLQVQAADGEPIDGFSAPVVAVRTDGAAIDLGVQPVTPTAVGTYTVDVVLPAPGTWAVQVSLRASEFDNPVTTIDFEVER